MLLPTAWAACSPNAKFDEETGAPCNGSPAIASGGIYIDETVSPISYPFLCLPPPLQNAQPLLTFFFLINLLSQTSNLNIESPAGAVTVVDGINVASALAKCEGDNANLGERVLKLESIVDQLIGQQANVDAFVNFINTTSTTTTKTTTTKSTTTHTVTTTSQTSTTKTSTTQNTLTVLFKLWGAGGAGGQHRNGNVGGGGGFISGKYSWVPGEDLTVVVGSGGKTHTYSSLASGTPYGGGEPNGGGGRGNYNSGGGGGSTHVLSNAKSNEVIIGAGGGGGGSGGLASGSGGGGGGGTENGIVGQGGNGAHNTESDVAGSSGGGAGGLGHLAGTPSNGATANGAGGSCAGNRQPGSGFGGGGGASSDKHVVKDLVISGKGVTPPNTNDKDYRNGAGKGGGHGSNPGADGLAVIVFLDADLAPRILTEGSHTISYPGN